MQTANIILSGFFLFFTERRLWKNKLTRMLAARCQFPFWNINQKSYREARGWRYRGAFGCIPSAKKDPDNGFEVTKGRENKTATSVTAISLLLFFIIATFSDKLAYWYSDSRQYPSKSTFYVMCLRCVDVNIYGESGVQGFCFKFHFNC